MAAASEPDSRVVELCGIGRMPVPAGFDTTASDGTPAPPNPLIDYAVQAARPRFQAVLRAGNAADRAAGLLMNFDMVPDASGRVDVPRPLLTLALQVRNPRILAAAMGQCARDAADGRCAAVARAWTGFEPDNAAAWLALQGADPTATPDALRGLASANRHQLHYGWLAAQVQARMPADIPAYVQMLLTIEAIGREAAFSVPPMQPLLALCRDAARGGEGMQAACTRLADVMRTIPTPWSG
ncbi:MAG: hypothetical protein ABIN96_16245 [Rubrivivax sp.]